MWPTFDANDVFSDLLRQKLIRNEFDEVVDSIDRGMHWFKTLDFMSYRHGRRILAVSSVARATAVVLVKASTTRRGTWTAQEGWEIHWGGRGSSRRSFHDEFFFNFSSAAHLKSLAPYHKCSLVFIHTWKRPAKENDEIQFLTLKTFSKPWPIHTGEKICKTLWKDQ